jgi:hypothetical protein
LEEYLAEETDLSDQYPGRVNELLQSWKDWSDPFPVSFAEKTKFTVD